MKTQIDKLVSLAKRYKDYGVKNEFNTEHKFTDIGEASIYFDNDRKTCSVCFDYCEPNEIEISLYINKLSFNFNLTEQDLETTYEKYYLLLNELEADQFRVDHYEEQAYEAENEGSGHE